MLSCSCDSDDYDFYIFPASDYEELSTRRRQRCCSCKTLIDLGALCLRINRTRCAHGDIEERIYGEDDPEAIVLGDWYLCETCADLFWSLEELGFCITLPQNMRQLVREYAELYAPPRPFARIVKGAKASGSF